MKKHIILTSFMLAVGSLLRGEESKHLVILLSEQVGKNTVEHKIALEAIRKSPDWNPENDEVPLSLNLAIKTARTWMTEKYPNLKNLTLGGVHVVQVMKRLKEPKIERWVYRINFMNGLGCVSQPVQGTVIVLMDGTVVETTIRPTDSSHPKSEAESGPRD